jgi:DNA primase
MPTPVEQIKERLSIEDVIGSYVKLIRSGKNLKAKCPFHNEKTPSFYVSPDRGGYYCFGCGAKGDIFSFVEQFEGLDFMGALKLLAERAGVDISRGKVGWGGEGGMYGADYTKSKSEKDRLYAIMEEAAIFFEKNLWNMTSDTFGVLAAAARDYIKKRGLTEKTMKEFRIGFVPNEWRLLYNHLRGKGFSDGEIEKAGLAKRPERGETSTAVAGTAGMTTQATQATRATSLYDRFRDRIMFPIFDSSGRVIAFSGRILHEDTGKKDTDGNTITAAKYLNSPDTPLYTKSTVLYGIDKAKQAIRERDYAILVEGQMDLVLSHQAGIKNTVAISGTALADTLVVKDSGEKGAPNIVNNLGIVRRLSTNLILAFDSDAAGRKAAMRSAGIALTLGMDVKIADLPEGKDPADLVLADPESWKNVLRKAKPIIEFALDHVLAEVAEKKLDSRKVPALLRERVYPFIAMLSNQTDQGHYVKMVRERALGNAENEAIIWEDVNKLQKAAALVTPAGQATARNGTISANAEQSHLDIIAKELFGLLAYLGREKILDVEGYYASVKTIAGDVRYHNLIASFEPSKDELAFKAEFFFGSTTDVRDDKSESALRRKVDEIILNFEEQIVRDDLARAMGRLPKVIESHDQTLSETLHKEIQELITKKSDIDRRRSLF